MATAPTTNPNITLPSGQVISGQDPNYATYAAQQTIAPPDVSKPVPTKNISNGSSLNFAQASVNSPGSNGLVAAAHAAATSAQPKATLINAAGEKVAVPIGSAEAQQYFGQGYQLMGSGGKFVAPPDKNSTSALDKAAGTGTSTNTGTAGTGATTGGASPDNGDYSQDPNVIKAQAGETQTETNLMSAENSQTSATDLMSAAEDKAGVAGAKTASDDATARYNALLADYNQTAADYGMQNATVEQKGVSSGTPAVFYQGEQAAMQKVQAAVLNQKATLVSSSAIAQATAAGNYQTAETLATKTADLAFQDQQQKINNLKDFVTLNQNNVNAAEKLALSKMDAQAKLQQIALDNQKTIMTMELTYPKAGITAIDTLVTATNKAATYLASNPTGMQLQKTGSFTDENGGTHDTFSVFNPQTNTLTPITPDSTTSSSILGISTGNLYGMPVYNTRDNNQGVTRAIRNNNPGNITATAGSVNMPGVVGVEKGLPKSAANPNGTPDMLIFSNSAAGAQASIQLLSTSKTYANMSAGAAIKMYNGNGSYSAADLGLNPKLDLQTQLKDSALLQNATQRLFQLEGYTKSNSNENIPPETQPTTPQPNFSPAGGFGTVSPDGQWKFTSQGWQPIPQTAAGPYADFLQGRSSNQVAAFNAMSPVQQSTIEQLVSGQALLSDLMRSRGIQGTQQIQKMIFEAQKVDPNFSVNENKLRYSFLQDWTSSSSKVGQTKIAINTALGHLADVSKMAGALSSSDIQELNKLNNWWSANTGNANITNLQFGLTQLATEIATAYKGGVPSTPEIEAENKVLGVQFSQGQFAGVFNTAAQFLSSKITSARYSYQTTMGQDYSQSLIDPEKRQALIDAGIDPNSIVKENVPGHSGGQTIQYNGKTYQVDAQGNMTEVQ